MLLAVGDVSDIDVRAAASDGGLHSRLSSGHHGGGGGFPSHVGNEKGSNWWLGRVLFGAAQI